MSKPSTPLSAPWTEKRLVFPAACIVAIAALAIAGFTAGSPAPPPQAKPVPRLATLASSTQTPSIRAGMGSLPLAFEANQGQTDPQVKYLARANGYTLFLTDIDAVFTLHSGAPANSAASHELEHAAKTAKKMSSQADSVMRLHLVGGTAHAKVEGQTPLPGKSNYFIGNDSSQWHTNVAQYARIAYENVYPGVNLAFYGMQRQMEFDFIVAPGANAARIQLGASGARRISTDNTGNLVLSADAGSVTLHKPLAYQVKNGRRDLVDARFVLSAKNHIGFELGNYDRSRELVIDPSVAFATFLGGSAEDDGYAIAVDANCDINPNDCNAYITGQTESTDFPTAGGLLPNTNSGGFDVFVTKISPTGSLVYSTYVGGSGDDSGNAIAVDSNGDAFVAGGTSSNNFPHTTGVKQTSLAGALNAFVFELDASGGSLAYSTYLGGSNSDSASGIAIDSSDDAYVVGSATSTNFPVTSNVIEGTLNGASAGFVTKLNPAGTSLVYSTYLGGGSGDNASGVAIDAAGDAYVTGETFSTTFRVTTGAFQQTCASCSSGTSDAFVSVINPAGSDFVYSTFLGGNSADVGFAIAVDSSDNAYVTGYTDSNNFPTQSPIQSAFTGSQDAFVTELNPTGTALVLSTYLGGSTTSGASSIALDSGGDIYVTGSTASTNFPTTSGAPQTTPGGGMDAFLTEIAPNTSSWYFSTFLGGTQNENSGVPAGSASIVGAVAVDPAGANIYLTGNTASGTNPGAFPITNAEQGTYGGGATDAFVAKYTQAAYGISATTPAAVNAGTSATSTVTLTSYYGYSATPVNLTCTVTGSGSPLPQCSVSSFSTNPVTPTSSGATTTLTITTTAAGGNAIRRTRHMSALWLPIAGLGFAGLFFGPLRRTKALGVLCLIVAATFFLPSCGGSSNSGGGGMCGAIPGAPTGLTASNTTSTGTTLTWTGPTVGGSCTLGSYTIYNNGTTSVGTSSTSSLNVTGLTPSTQYSFTVAASDQAGMGPQSSAVTVTTGTAGTPSGNYMVTVTGTDTNNVMRSAQVIVTVN